MTESQVPSRLFLADSSQDVKPLPGLGLSDTLSPMIEPFATRVRKRVREELDRLGLVQADIAGQLKWSQSKVAQKLNGRTPWTLEELDALCFIAGIQPTEAVRDRGLEFCAEMTPTEMRLLERIRQLPQPDQDAIMRVLGVATKTRPHERRAAPVVQKRKRSV